MSTTEEPSPAPEEKPAEEAPQPEAVPETPTAFDPVTGEQIEVDPNAPEFSVPVATGEEGEAAPEESADE